MECKEKCKKWEKLLKLFKKKSMNKILIFWLFQRNRLNVLNLYVAYNQVLSKNSLDVQGSELFSL